LSPADPAPTEEPGAPAGAREPGSGRPTKQDRRAIARFTRGHDS
jgi:hypothetical protein